MLNSTNQVISAQDYDAWGYPLENRTYNSTAMRYDFTGKERDIQTTYDYFGARYYDSRIANWTSVDPKFEREFGESPYIYVSRNSIKYFDIDGRVKFPAELQGKYSKLTSFLKNDLPNLVNDKEIMQSLEKWSGRSSLDITADFQWDSGPEINVESMSNWGSFNPEKPNIIKIKDNLVNDLENNNGDVGEILEFFVKVVVLHEYAHYAANKSGISFIGKDENGSIQREEEGLRFEESAFGQQIGGPDVAAKYMNAVNKKTGNAKSYPTNIEENLRKGWK